MDDEFRRKLVEALRRVQISGGLDGNAGKNRYMAGYGRLGYEFPVGEDSLTLGLSGNGIVAPGFKQFKPSGIDASYQKGPNTFGVEYNQPASDDKNINLYYRRSF